MSLQAMYKPLWTIIDLHDEMQVKKHYAAWVCYTHSELRELTVEEYGSHTHLMVVGIFRCLGAAAHADLTKCQYYHWDWHHLKHLASRLEPKGSKWQHEKDLMLFGNFRQNKKNSTQCRREGGWRFVPIAGDLNEFVISGIRSRAPSNVPDPARLTHIQHVGALFLRGWRNTPVHYLVTPNSTAGVVSTVQKELTTLSSVEVLREPGERERRCRAPSFSREQLADIPYTYPAWLPREGGSVPPRGILRRMGFFFFLLGLTMQ
ncbi:hypothetical protein C8R47DRAFT_1063562 [Mycena vitilis]|nr:hypothetical protein C8R47DRAFT_1063562 [Mycena vitilis]